MVDDSTTPRSRRGATTILNYALLVAIVTLLVVGLLVGVSGFVESQQERAIRSQLDTVGNRLAADIETAGRLATVADGDRVRLRSDLPDTVAGSQYRVEIVNASGDRYRLALSSSEPEVRTVVIVRSPVPVSGTISGGQLVITYDSGANELEVTNG